MRNGQKRMRGRNNNHRKSQNPLTRVYESNGPDVKIRGTASHVAEKYIQLARDSQSSGDPVAAENYYQHAEHYFRLIAAAQEQFRQQNPYYNNQQPQQGQNPPQGAADDNYDDGDDDQPFLGQNEPNYAPQPRTTAAASVCRATRSRFRRATSSTRQPPAAALSAATVRHSTVAATSAACPPSSPAADSSRSSSTPTRIRRTATTRATARTASVIAGGGVIAAAAIAPTARISAMPIRKAPHRRCRTTAATSRPASARRIIRLHRRRSCQRRPVTAPAPA